MDKSLSVVTVEEELCKNEEKKKEGENVEKISKKKFDEIVGLTVNNLLMSLKSDFEVANKSLTKESEIIFVERIRKSVTKYYREIYVVDVK